VVMVDLMRGTGHRLYARRVGPPAGALPRRGRGRPSEGVRLEMGGSLLECRAAREHSWCPLGAADGAGFTGSGRRKRFSCDERVETIMNCTAQLSDL
jgi:hypothetical protein